MKKLLLLSLLVPSIGLAAPAHQYSMGGRGDINELTKQVVKEKMKHDKSLYIAYEDENTVILESRNTPKFSNDPGCEKTLRRGK